MDIYKEIELEAYYIYKNTGCADRVKNYFIAEKYIMNRHYLKLVVLKPNYDDYIHPAF